MKQELGNNAQKIRGIASLQRKKENSEPAFSLEKIDVA